MQNATLLSIMTLFYDLVTDIWVLIWDMPKPYPESVSCRKACVLFRFTQYRTRERETYIFFCIIKIIGKLNCAAISNTLPQHTYIVTTRHPSHTIKATYLCHAWPRFTSAPRTSQKTHFSAASDITKRFYFESS